MTVYQDPRDARRRPDLISDLMTVPATLIQHQLENQATSVLSWLSDSSLPFARALATLCLGSPKVPASTEVIGARTQVSLPSLNGGSVFPDLSLDGSDRRFQVLIEVKVDATFHGFASESGLNVPQPDFYRQSWMILPASEEARVRAVSTLTRSGTDAAADLSVLRGCDISWDGVANTLDQLLATNQIGSDVGTVARSFVRAIRERIAPRPPDPAELKNYLEHMRPRVAKVIARITDALQASMVAGGSGSDYFGMRVRVLDVEGKPLFVRVYATPVGGRLNVPGRGDAVIAVLERTSDGHLELSSRPRAVAAGFHRLRDIDSYWMHRAIWSADADPEQIGSALVEGIRAAGLVP